MNMFQSVLDTVPKTRSQLVTELDLPEDITVAPYVWVEEDSLSTTDSLPSVSVECDVITASSDSSLALSRAMTDSEIDYERYRRLKSRSFSDPWLQMRAALDAFPPGYLDSLNRQGNMQEKYKSIHQHKHHHQHVFSPAHSRASSGFQNTSEATGDDEPSVPHQRYSEELRLKMERFFEEECRVFSPEDPGLLALEEALHDLDLKVERKHREETHTPESSLDVVVLSTNTSKILIWIRPAYVSQGILYSAFSSHDALCVV